jgi:hypothetical protein
MTTQKKSTKTTRATKTRTTAKPGAQAETTAQPGGAHQAATTKSADREATAPSVREAALHTARARWAEAGPPRKGTVARGARLEAVITAIWQILGYAGLSKVRARLAVMPVSELSPSLVPDLRTATLALELAAERSERAAALNRPGPAAESVVPNARAVLKRLVDGAEDFFGEDPEVRAALDAIPGSGIGPVSLARHLGTLSSLLAARIDGLGENTGRLKRPDLETARELRATLRPANVDGLDPETAEIELEHAYRWAEWLYEELAGVLGWLDRRSDTAPRWPSLASVGRKPPKRKADKGAATPRRRPRRRRRRWRPVRRPPVRRPPRRAWPRPRPRPPSRSRRRTPRRAPAPTADRSAGWASRGAADSGLARSRRAAKLLKAGP